MTSTNPMFSPTLSHVEGLRFVDRFVEIAAEKCPGTFLLIMGSRVRVPPRSPNKINHLSQKISLQTELEISSSTHPAHARCGNDDSPYGAGSCRAGGGVARRRRCRADRDGQQFRRSGIGCGDVAPIQSLVIFAVVASSIHWQWTPNGYLASLIGVGLAWLLTALVTELPQTLKGLRRRRSCPCGTDGAVRLTLGISVSQFRKKTPPGVYL